jgi:hypothetical protein
MLPHTRRTFLKAGTAAATAPLTQARRATAINGPNAGKAGALLLSQFDDGDIELSQGPVPRQFDANYAPFLSTEIFRFLD